MCVRMCADRVMQGIGGWEVDKGTLERLAEGGEMADRGGGKGWGDG